MTTRNYSEQELGQFLDYLGQKGLMKEATAKARKVSALKVLGALDDHEKLDLRQVDRDGAFQRFVNKEGKSFTPDSLKAYKSRFNGAVDDFLRYSENPTGFKTTTEQRSVRSPVESKSVRTNKKIAEDSRQPLPAAEASPQKISGGSTIDIPVPLRSGVVMIKGLPTDLTAPEALRISAIITAFAVSEDV